MTKIYMIKLITNSYPSLSIEEEITYLKDLLEASKIVKCAEKKELSTIVPCWGYV